MAEDRLAIVQEENSDETKEIKKVTTATDLQRHKLEKLLKDPVSTFSYEKLTWSVFFLLKLNIGVNSHTHRQWLHQEPEMITNILRPSEQNTKYDCL